MLFHLVSQFVYISKKDYNKIKLKRFNVPNGL